MSMECRPRSFFAGATRSALLRAAKSVLKLSVFVASGDAVAGVGSGIRGARGIDVGVGVGVFNMTITTHLDC